MTVLLVCYTILHLITVSYIANMMFCNTVVAHHRDRIHNGINDVPGYPVASRVELIYEFSK